MSTGHEHDLSGDALEREQYHAQLQQHEKLIEKRGFRKRIAFLLLVLVALAAVFAAILVLDVLPVFRAHSPDDQSLTVPSLAALGLLFFAILFVLQRYVYSLFNTLEELRSDVILATQGVRDLPQKWFINPPNASEVELFAQSLAILTETNQSFRAHAEGRLEAIITALDNGIVAFDQNGMVTISNRAAQGRLGRQAIGNGTSIFAALNAGELQVAMEEARESNRVIDVEIKDNNDRTLKARIANLGRQGRRHAGYVLILEAPPAAATALRAAEADVRDDAAAEDDSPPPMIGFGDTGPGPEAVLTELPFFAIGLATTGQSGEERLVSLAAVRMHGRRIYHQVNFDHLINPNMLIPVEASRRHGITNFTVKDRPPFEDLWPTFGEFTRGGIIVGYHMGHMLQVLDSELRRADLAWDPLMTIDVAELYQRMEDLASAPSLEKLASEFGVTTYGRHTAMGDALIVAEVFSRLLQRLRNREVTSYAGLLRSLEGTGQPERV